MKQRIITVVVGVAMAGLMLARPAVQAHHAFAAEFDARKPVVLNGTVSKVEWVNPHVWIHVDVKTPDGKIEPWAIEAGTPNVLFRRGVTKQSLKAGTEVEHDLVVLLGDVDDLAAELGQALGGKRRQRSGAGASGDDVEDDIFRKRWM